MYPTYHTFTTRTIHVLPFTIVDVIIDILSLRDLNLSILVVLSIPLTNAMIDLQNLVYTQYPVSIRNIMMCYSFWYNILVQTSLSTCEYPHAQP